MSGRLDLQFNFSTPSPSRRSPEHALRILLIGNFRGDRPAGHALAERPIQRVDIDNFDHILAALAPQLTLQHPDCHIEFNELDDFHPDQLYRKLSLFQELRQLRKKLSDPASAAQAIAELTDSTPSITTPTPSPSTQTEADSSTPSGSLFEQLLGGSPQANTVQSNAGQSGVPLADAFIRSAIAEYIVTSPDTSTYLHAIDMAHSDSLRAILHNPAWQALEANWRGLWWLVSELVTDGELSLHLLDVDRQELEADLTTAHAALDTSALYQRLAAEHNSADDQPWSLIVALHDWSATAAAILQLATLSAISQAAGGTLLSAASPAFLGLTDFASAPKQADFVEPASEFQHAWDSLRRSPLAASLGLALPRVLLRLPYGPADPIDSFEFNEQAAIPEHSCFLWGNPALACTLVLGRQFMRDGWAMTTHLRPDTQLDIDAMPAYSYKLDGESHLQACAETFLSESAALRISQQGLIPLLSFRHRNAVRVAGLYSCALDRSTLLTA